ncbi:MAG TPA: hypothetical protein VF868_15175 [Bacteroidia bacterium]|jgi:hypothetical protein
MKSKNEILNEIANDPTFYEVCKNVSKAQGTYTKLDKDLYQECMLILLEKPDCEIVEAYNKSYTDLKRLFVRIVLNQWSSGGKKVKGYSPFYKKFRKENQLHCLNGGLYEEKYNFDFQYLLRDETDFTAQKLGHEDKQDTATPYPEIEELTNEVLDIIDKMYFFDKHILLIYLEGNWTFTSLSKELGIGRNKINDSIQNSKKHIREQLKIKRNKKNIW